MPKTNLCKPDYSIANEKLVEWIRKQGKQKVIAKGIGISPQSMNYKLKSKSFSLVEMMRIFHFLKTEPDEIVKLMTY